MCKLRWICTLDQWICPSLDRALKCSFALRLITLCHLMLRSCAIASPTLYHAILGNCDSHCHLVSTRAEISIPLARKKETGPPHADTPLTTNRHILLFLVSFWVSSSTTGSTAPRCIASYRRRSPAPTDPYLLHPRKLPRRRQYESQCGHLRGG